MAGAGYKLFQTGDVLTAAQVNTYLNEQTVMVFASAAARTSALTSVLAEGMVSYLQDTNAVEVYDGSAWVSIGASGDITGVTAGTGISGGGTSGTVTITNDMATTITAAGDIVVGTGSGTYDNLPIGTTGQVLTADTTVSPYKVKWATASAGGGKVLQVVYGSTSTATTSSSTTWSDSGLSASITPSSATSKVLVLVSQNGCRKSNGNTDNALELKLRRSSTDLIVFCFNGGFTQSTLYNGFGSASCEYLDEPNTTSSVTYKTQMRNQVSQSLVSVQTDDSATSTMILMEIGA